MRNMRRVLLSALAGLAFSTAFSTVAAAGDDSEAFKALVLPAEDIVEVEGDDGVVYELVDGWQLLSDGVIAEGDTIAVERVADNPRTVVALEDTHF